MLNAMSQLNSSLPDHHARMRAGGQLVQLIGANPPKTSAPDRGSAQVAVVIEMPEWARPQPRAARARVVNALPARPAE